MGIRIEAPESDWVTYVPDVLDNRVDDDPMTVEIRPMSAADMRSMQSTYGARLAGKQGHQRAMRLVAKVITERVRDVRNCYVGREIKTGAELAEHGLSAMIDDVFGAIIDLSKLQEGLRKKSDSPSDSGQAEILPSIGAPKDAAMSVPAAYRALNG